MEKTRRGRRDLKRNRENAKRGGGRSSSGAAGKAER